jgi:hypothetical protein
MSVYLTVWDLIIPPLYLCLIVLFCSYVRHKNIEGNPAYKYYLPGMLVKIFCAVSIVLVYTLYYSSGDSTGYYEQGVAIKNLFFKNPGYFFEVLFGGSNASNYSYLDDNTTYVAYNTWINDYSAMYISRIVAVLLFVTFNSFIATTMLLAWICYSGIWRLYLLFCEQFPLIRKELAISILFIPSVVFWGSGLLKDTITLSAVGWYAYCFYNILNKKHY